MTLPYHEEILRVLRKLANPKRGEAIRRDRGSELAYLGIRTPALRRAVKEGFSFYDLPEEKVLEIWNELWMRSPYGEVLFAALEYYGPRVRKRVGPELWPVMKGWSRRIENWAHADFLSGIYSRILEKYPREVYPQLVRWNKAKTLWLRRLSLVSLIHYASKNAVFLEPDRVLPLVLNCLTDERYHVQKAVGWVLREMGHVYPEEIRAFLTDHVMS
ncbi:MAG: DNA alkylation repair protein, partial [Thermoplasmata archaeon]